MKTPALRLVFSQSKRRTYYVASKKDFEILCSLKVPLRKITEDMLPLLRQTCKKAKVEVMTKGFALIEAATFEKIRQRWPELNFEKTSNKVVFEVSNKKEVERLQLLTDAVAEFYKRHLYDVEIVTKKRGNIYRIILTVELNHEKEPGWK